MDGFEASRRAARRGPRLAASSLKRPAPFRDSVQISRGNWDSDERVIEQLAWFSDVVHEARYGRL
jgi:hypothetical protein